MDGATPIIEDVTVQWQKEDGIHIENAVSDAPIISTTLQDYHSVDYDVQLTETAGITQPLSPTIANGDFAHMIWVEEEPVVSETIQHLMYSRSVDNGNTWSPQIILASSQDILGVPLTPSIASDGRYVGIVYINSSGGQMNVELIYSEDNGETWSAPIYLSPRDEFFAGTPCIDWQGDTGYIVYKTNPLDVEPGYEFRGIAYRTFSGSPGVIEDLFYVEGGYGIPKIDVDGNDIHVVFCAPDSPDPSISDKAIYLHGDLALGTWNANINLTTYELNGIMFDHHAFDLKARNGVVYFIWHNYDSGN